MDEKELKSLQDAYTKLQQEHVTLQNDNANRIKTIKDLTDTNTTLSTEKGVLKTKVETLNEIHTKYINHMTGFNAVSTASTNKQSLDDKEKELKKELKGEKRNESK